jgi:tol-pal system protein YbgF
MQLQGTITRFRSDIEEKSNATPPTAPPVMPGTAQPPVSSSGTRPIPVGTPPVSGVDTVAAPPRGPGPTTLYTSGMDQLRRGSTSTARTMFQELLSNYPTSDLAPDAQYQIAESLLKEKNLAGADAAFAAVVAKYGDSPKASTALYKRATIALQQGNKPDAIKLFTEVTTRYSKSNEAELAADQLKLLR